MMKSSIKFEMIQDYKAKLKILKQNLLNSQKLNTSLKQQLLQIGQQSNSLLISISSLTSKTSELRSLNPQKLKQLNFTKEELKRMQYKTQKHEIKLKQYEDRLKRFEEMYKMKKEKNQSLKDKIQKLEVKLVQEKEKEKDLTKELSILDPKSQPNNMSSLKIQSTYLKSLHKKSNPLDDVQVQLLTQQSKLKKLNQQKQELRRKNNLTKSNINKLQQQITSIQQFLSQNSCIPTFSERQEQKINQSSQKNYTTSRNSNQIDEARILKYSDRFNLTIQQQKYNSTDQQSQDRIRKPFSKLPNHILSNLSNFQNLKSKSMLDSLISKHSQITERQQLYAANLQENFLLMNQLTKINSILESQILQENSKLNSFNIRNKKYTQMHQKSLY